MSGRTRGRSRELIGYDTPQLRDRALRFAELHPSDPSLAEPEIVRLDATLDVDREGARPEAPPVPVRSGEFRDHGVYSIDGESAYAFRWSDRLRLARTLAMLLTIVALALYTLWRLGPDSPEFYGPEGDRSAYGGAR